MPSHPSLPLGCCHGFGRQARRWFYRLLLLLLGLAGVSAAEGSSCHAAYASSKHTAPKLMDLLTPTLQLGYKHANRHMGSATRTS